MAPHRRRQDLAATALGIPPVGGGRVEEDAVGGGAHRVFPTPTSSHSEAFAQTQTMSALRRATHRADFSDC
jgi:hypothetical protein